ncbi:unnamed protein product [Prunus armeniaca]
MAVAVATGSFASFRRLQGRFSSDQVFESKNDPHVVPSKTADYMFPEFCTDVRLKLTKCPLSLARNAAQAD